MDHYTVTGAIVYDLGRGRQLSLGCAGTPNEMLFLTQLNDSGDGITDCIVIHNYDYDGILTINKMKLIIDILL